MPTTNYLRDKAAWSEFTTRNVDPNAPRNLATRAREQRAMMDQEALATAQVEEEANAMKSLARRDRVAQSLFLGQQRIAETKRMHDEQIRINQIKANQEAELFPLKKAALERQAASAVALERARINDADFKEWQRGQQAEDAYNFSDFIRKSGHRVGSPGYLETVVKAKQLFPGVPTQIFDDTWKTTGSQRTPEEVQQSIAAARAANPNATITATEKGTTITDRPPNAGQPDRPPNAGQPDRPTRDPRLTVLKRELGVLEAKQIAAASDDRKALNEPIKLMRDKIAELEGGATPTQAQRPVFKDKNGNRAYKNPDGTFEPIP